MNERSSTLEFSAGDTTYTVDFSRQAIEALVSETGIEAKQLPYVLGNPATLDGRLMILTLWAGLRAHHPDIDQHQAALLFKGDGYLDLWGKVAVALGWGLDAIGEFHFPDEDLKH